MIARALMGGGVRNVILSAYGMKICMHELSMLDNIRQPINPPLSQIYVGINCVTDYIPLLTLNRVIKVNFSQCC